MPIAPTYPGVYIEEIPSGVRTITGVATSITALLGRAPRGPADSPETITSFADFVRRFGGLAAGYPMSYAVSDFFQNGGSTALGVGADKTGDGRTDGDARLPVDKIKLKASSPGRWGNKLRAEIVLVTGQDARDALGLPANADLFNLTVRDTTPGGAIETIMNLAGLQHGGRRVARTVSGGRCRGKRSRHGQGKRRGPSGGGLHQEEERLGSGQERRPLRPGSCRHREDGLGRRSGGPDRRANGRGEQRERVEWSGQPPARSGRLSRRP